MSIWRHITDIELQRLKEARRALQAEEVALTELDRVHQETTVKLYSARSDMQRYEELVVSRAVGEADGPPLQTPATDAELRILLNGVNRRRVEQQRDINHSKSRYDALVAEAMKACVARAADIHRGQTEVLVETWQEINTALAASETPTLSWRYVFIPALEGMRGATESHSRPALFTGGNPNVAAMEAELARVLSL